MGGKTVTRADLAEAVYRKVGLSRTESAALVEMILDDPRVHGVALTGSEAAGAQVAALAGKALKKSTMELGGADAFVVLADADLEKTVNWAVFGRHWNAGQVCVSPTRFYIQEPVWERFMARFCEHARGIKVGSGLDADTKMGPLAHARRVSAMAEFVEDARTRGARIEAGGKLRFITDTHTPVITNGAPTRVEMIAVAAGGD